MSTSAIVAFVQQRLTEVAIPSDAPAMAAYMKSETPFLGVRSAPRKAILRDLKKAFTPRSPAEVVEWSRALWDLPHREERYLGIGVARAWRKHVVRASLPHYEHLIRTGAWWDYVDEVAVNLVGAVWLKDPSLAERMDEWIEDEDLWIRRTAIIAQLKHRDGIDEDRLFAYCLKCADEKDFFIRKAIGWALRQHAKAAPERVIEFTDANRDRWAGLTWREARKHL